MRQSNKNHHVLVVKGLGKMYPIYLNEKDRIKEFFTGRRHLEFWALRDISFELESGKSLGIIGANGAGKSTLLKLLSGISRPTEGHIERNGKVSTLLELGLGFRPDFSGRDNIRLNCLLMGMRKSEIEERTHKIIEFAELEEFIDYPIKTYSNGMLLRLGFSIAVHTEADLFLIDEVLAVGDQYFQRKCIEKIGEFISSKKSIILVSHDLHSIRSLCEETLWLHGGRMVAKGPTDNIVRFYIDYIREGGDVGERKRRIVTDSRLILPNKERWIDEEEEVTQPPNSPVDRDEPTILDYYESLGSREYLEILKSAGVGKDAEKVWKEKDEVREYSEYHSDNPIVTGSGEIKILDVKFLNRKGEDVKEIQTFDPLIISVTFKTLKPIEDPIMGIAIFRNDNVYVYGPNTRFDNVMGGKYFGIYTYFINYMRLPLLPGLYQISVAIWDKYHLRPYIWHNRLYDLRVSSNKKDHGIVYLEHSWGLLTHVKGDQEEIGPGDEGGG